MDPYVTGAVIRQLREKNRLTQAQLAEKLQVSDKAVSKWENGRGYPDITLLEPLAKAFGVSVAELLSGSTVTNRNPSGNILRSKFYVCPLCGNVLHGMGEAVIHCHGVPLPPLEAEAPEEGHRLFLEPAEDEYYVRIGHEMSRTHHITFIAALSTDRLQLVKLYPEWNAEARFKRDGVQKLLYYCNKDGLFQVDPRRV